MTERVYKQLSIKGIMIAYSIIKNYHDSEDIVSKSMIALLNQDKENIKNLEKYFNQIVRNEAKKLYNTQKKESEVMNKHKQEKQLEQTEIDIEKITSGLHWKTIYSYLNKKEIQLYKDWKKFQNSKEIGKKQKKSTKTISSQISRLKQTLSAIRFKTNNEVGGTVKQLTYLEFKRLTNFINTITITLKMKDHTKQKMKTYFETVNIQEIPAYDELVDYEVKRNNNIYTLVLGCKRDSKPVIWLINFFFDELNHLKIIEINKDLIFAKTDKKKLLPPNPKTLIIPQKYDQI